MSTTLSSMPTSSMPATIVRDPLAVAIDGTESDHPALLWAAEEASQLGRPQASRWLTTQRHGWLARSLG